MVKITEELLKKRAEHNEMRLTTLEEVTLHQYEIQKIENLDILCRHLKILYLQNNIIEKLENLNKLKELEYLNIALNNITKIENIEGCESLKKLDLTVNFIDMDDLVESCENLRKNELIRELYLTGNPCTDFEKYREIVIAIVPQLAMLDGKEILPKERIIALQNLEENKINLLAAAEMAKIEQEKKRLHRLANPDPNGAEPYSRENRKQMYLEQAAQKEADDRRKNPKDYEVKVLSKTHHVNGEVRQCNEGKYEWLLREHDDPEYSFFDIQIPKFMDTSLIDANIFPDYVSVRVKDKLTQIRLGEEVIVNQSSLQRSQITGIIIIASLIMIIFLTSFMIKIQILKQILICRYDQNQQYFINTKCQKY